MDEKHKWTLKQVAVTVGVHSATIMRWITLGKVSVKKKKNSRGHHVFTESDVEELKSYYGKVIEVE